MSRTSRATRSTRPRISDAVGPKENPSRSMWRPVRAVLDHPMADYGMLLGVTLALVVLGVIMVMSASTVYSLEEHGSSYTLAGRQLMFAAMGIVGMLVIARLPVEFFHRISFPLLVVSGVLLVLVLVPGIGVSANGQQNWLSIGGPFRLQPSEIAKLALIIWLADLLARRHKRVDGWRSLLLPLLPVTGIFVLLILIGGDLGTCLVIMPLVAMMLLVAGAPMKLFAWLGAGALSLIGLMSVTTPYRLARFKTWLDPQNDPTGAGYQVIHGQFALATGGWWGVGLGASREKWGFLPEAHTDFILTVLGEELGLAGTLSVLGLFAIFAAVAMRVALRATTLFARLAAAGVGIWVVIQALINIGAVLGALPITGLPLPLISYGGTSLTVTLVGIGMLLAFARNEPAAAEFLARRRDEKRRLRQETRPTVKGATSSGRAPVGRRTDRVRSEKSIRRRRRP
ncbi:MAG: putative lipid II flippase FtsW [Candidatus Nanopelagicales bacterium]|nr:putative lipid II flippase FtsW [Candidatus Nanopelagicales bacterium]